MDFFSYVIAVFLGSAPAVAAIGFLGKAFIDKLIKREAMREEAEVKRDARREEAALKLRSDLASATAASGLQRQNLEHQVQFTKLHERRLDILAALYKHIAGTLRAADELVAPGRGELVPKNRSVLSEKARLALDELTLYLDDHQIYLPIAVQEQAHALVKRLDGAVFEVSTFYDELGSSINSAEGEPGVDLSRWNDEKVKAQARAWREVSTVGLTIRRSLESEFRRLLEPRHDA